MDNVVRTAPPALRGGKTNVRWWLAVLFFGIGLIAYMDRSNIAVVAVPIMDELGIDKVQFGLLASMFTLGYFVVQIPGGMLAEKFGARKVIAWALTLWSVFTIATAMASQFVAMLIVRFLFGVGEGPLFPANAVFNSLWFQNTEKGRAASALLAGSFFGPVIAPIVTVAIYQAFGWHGVFYVFGAAGLLLAVLWWIVGRDSPEQHPWVSEYERNLITMNRAIPDKANRTATPWRRLLRTPAFWAIGIGFACVGYCNMLFLVWLPTYLQEERGFSLQAMGFAAALPWLAICMVVLFGSGFSDALVARGKSRMVARGIPAIVGLVVFGVAMYLATLATSPGLNVMWLTIALGALGAPTLAFWSIVTEKSGQYAGSVGGWMNTWGNAGQFVSPLLAGILAQSIGWNAALLTTLVPIGICILMWVLIKPDESFAETLPVAQPA